MKKILMTMAAVSALSIGVPAAAQYGRGDIQGRMQQLQVQLQAGVRSGAISRREAMPLDRQIREISDYARFNGRDGLNGRERRYLEQRMANLSQHIRYAEQTGDGRDMRYGRGERYEDGRAYGANEGYAREARLDRNGDGWDDRDFDRDGRIDDGRDGEDGAYLRVGQRISGNFAEMPVRYRDRYRDSDGSYYRYDRGNIYQVDARTDLILRIFADAR